MRPDSLQYNVSGSRHSFVLLMQGVFNYMPLELAGLREELPVLGG